MNKLLLTLISLASYPSIAQTSCENQLDSAEVIRIAKRHHAYWSNERSRAAQISFNDQTCEWAVYSSRHKHTDRGNCKKTSGCTLVKEVTLILDANTQKVKSKKRSRKLYPNYE